MRAPQRTRQRRRLSRRYRTRHDASDEEPIRACDAVIMDVPGACPAEYQLVEGPPTLDEYLNLRMRAGLSPRRPDQALAALDGGWAALHVVHQPTATTVGMGRRFSVTAVGTSTYSTWPCSPTTNGAAWATPSWAHC